MAAIFKRGKTWWITYRVDNKRVRRSLDTDNERVARDRLKHIDGLSKIGESRTVRNARAFRSGVPFAGKITRIDRAAKSAQRATGGRTAFCRPALFYPNYCDRNALLAQLYYLGFIQSGRSWL
jgi:hypothetical protein